MKDLSWKKWKIDRTKIFVKSSGMMIELTMSFIVVSRCIIIDLISSLLIISLNVYTHVEQITNTDN